MKLVYPNALDIVGFATESGRGEDGTEDAIYYDARLWNDKDEAEARELQRTLKILTTGTRQADTEFEFPPPNTQEVS